MMVEPPHRGSLGTRKAYEVGLPLLLCERKKVLISPVVRACFFVTKNFAFVFPSENGEMEPQDVLSQVNIRGLPQEDFFP